MKYKKMCIKYNKINRFLHIFKGVTLAGNKSIFLVSGP